jgi:hypothetical protein
VVRCRKELVPVRKSALGRGLSALSRKVQMSETLKIGRTKIKSLFTNLRPATFIDELQLEIVHEIARTIGKMDDLFDVFDDKPQSEIPEKPKKAKKEKKDKSKKRTANGDVKKDQDGDAEMVDTEQAVEAAEEDSNILVEKKETKRRRREEEAEPVVTDTFQTEQSREVAASAGLQAKDDGALVIQSMTTSQFRNTNPPRSRRVFGPSN